MEAEGIKAKSVNSIHKTFYYKWKKLDHREVTRMYCEYLNRLMQKAGLAKTSVMDRAVTSINGRQGEILAAIKEMAQSQA